MESLMTADKHVLSYPLGEAQPEAGQMMEVAAGVYWLRMPLPFALNHINVWLLRDEIDGREGWTLIDTGVARPEIQAHWEHVFEHGLDGLPVLRVVVTHMHPDHVGLAGWVCERWDAPLYMTMTDYMVARFWTQPDPEGSLSSGPNGRAAAAHLDRKSVV